MLREEAVIALFRQIEEWGQPTAVAFEAGKQVSEKSIPVILGQLRRTAPHWRDFWYPTKRRVDALTARELSEKAAAFDDQVRLQVAHGLLKTIEYVQMRERLTNRDRPADVDERERYWEHLLPWAGEEIGFELREAMAHRQEKTTTELRQAADDAANIEELLSQALEAVPVEHPSHQSLSVASMDAYTFYDVLKHTSPGPPLHMFALTPDRAGAAPSLAHVIEHEQG